MQLSPFLLDQWLGAHEFATPSIQHNLASSTGPSWSLSELLKLCGESTSSLDNIRLGYAPPQGSLALREAVARFYDVDPEWVVAMTGASEAMLCSFCLAAEQGGSALLPSPMFPAFATVAQAWGLQLSTYSLDRASGFEQTADYVLSAVTAKTKIVLVNTPHNPSGSVMNSAEVEKLAAALAERNIPLVVDEVYHPLYFGEHTASAATIRNALVVSDFSKAFSLPGLRIGWIIERDPARRERLIDARSYFTISGSPLTEAVAVQALRNIEPILHRLQLVAETNLGSLKQFMHVHRDRFAWVPPQGGTVAFPWRRDGKNTRPMCERLAKAGVLFAPGDCFAAPDHFRIGFGARDTGFASALEIVSTALKAIE